VRAAAAEGGVERVLVDSSVWIAYLRGDDVPEAQILDDLLAGRPGPGVSPLTTGLVLTEVLQGIRDDATFEHVRADLSDLPRADLEEADYLDAARLYRLLRRQELTIRSTIDVLLAALCLRLDCPLLHRDRDFAPIARAARLRIYEGGSGG